MDQRGQDRISFWKFIVPVADISEDCGPHDGRSKMFLYEVLSEAFQEIRLHALVINGKVLVLPGDPIVGVKCYTNVVTVVANKI